MQTPTVTSSLWPLVARHANIKTLCALTATSKLWRQVALEELDRRVNIQSADVVVSQAIWQDAPFAAKKYYNQLTRF